MKNSFVKSFECHLDGLNKKDKKIRNYENYYKFNDDICNLRKNQKLNNLK
ncbi:hypothetical protein CLPU_3c00400 [Gottschalkia purinilytica]|uniref:Uncharacterized protein n=1 Tax=Gottschalkia purinilytica TaxID=1503 RepID=A0A0L0WCR8_GOTPU|nr:hypothetical protein [Gottschalkia purinilytica]KNF09262.1 hypothetical protein CLPU_3c00400 [Gottschalkia purinilytica]